MAGKLCTGKPQNNAGAGWDFSRVAVGTVPDVSGTCCAAVPLVEA